MQDKPRPRVLIAADVDPWLIDRLASDDRFDTVFKPCYSESEMSAQIGGFETVITRYHNDVTESVISGASSLRLIIQGTSGLDNIDHAAAAERGVRIIGIPGENANAVAELVLGFVLSLSRTIGQYGSEMRERQWTRADCATRHELSAWRAGIVGLGRVGTRVSRLFGLLGIPVAAYDPYLSESDFSERGATRRSTIDELLASATILTLHVPLTHETRRMISAPQLDVLPRGAIVINTSRGPVLDIEAALERLQRRALHGVALDVYDVEPPERGWPDDPQLLLTPHVAGCTAEAKESIAREVYRQLCLAYAIDPAVS